MFSINSPTLAPSHFETLSADGGVPSKSGNSSPQVIFNDKEVNLQNELDGEKQQKVVELEDDVSFLSSKLNEEIHIRKVLKQALGRASSSFGSAQKFAAPVKTQKLVKDIALLELEVANLEQHLLALYRSAFERQLQRISSTDNDLDVNGSSTALNDEQEVLKAAQYSILPNNGRCQNGLFLSKDTDKELNNDLANESEIGLSTSSCNTTPKRDLAIRSSYSQPVLTNDTRDYMLKTPTRPVSQQISSSESSKNTSGRSVQSGNLTDSLSPLVKEKLCESPNKLSEQLVRCMAAIYCKLADPPLQNLSVGTFSPSSSSSGGISSPQEVSSDGWSPKLPKDTSSCEFSLSDPYDVTGGRNESVGPYNYMVEVPWICVDNDRLTYAARMLRDFRSLIQHLEKVDPGQMKHAEKLAFWINVYNALVMHGYLAYGIPRNHLKRVSLLQKAAYKIGAYSINAHTIEQSILNCRSHRPAQWLQSLLSPGAKFKGDERQAYAIESPEPLVCFALCCGGRSDPAVRVYSAKNIYQELEVAKREFLQASVGIRKGNKVVLPRILDSFSRESLISPSYLLEWVCQHLQDEKQREAVKKCGREFKPHKGIEWVPYNFSFRYVFVRDLVRWFPSSTS